MKLLNSKYLHTMVSDKKRNMIFGKYYYLPLTLVRLAPLSRPVHAEVRGEMLNHHWESEHHKQVLNVKQILYQAGFPNPLGRVLFSSHLPHPHSHIIYSWPLLPPRKITTAIPEWSHAPICELTQGHPVCISAITVSLSVDDESCFPTRLSQGYGQRPQEPLGILQASQCTSRERWDQSLWWTLDLLKGPPPPILS